MVVRICVDPAHCKSLSVIRPSVENTPFRRGEGMLMVVRTSCWWHCGRYVSCEGPHGMFLLLYSGTNHMGGHAQLVHIYWHCCIKMFLKILQGPALVHAGEKGRERLGMGGPRVKYSVHLSYRFVDLLYCYMKEFGVRQLLPRPKDGALYVRAMRLSLHRTETSMCFEATERRTRPCS